ncbi:PKD domain-containing protein [Flavobacterium sp. 90]|uniref:PKD domain-containing protein n=1 Tax=unclassified Flavobacterium TaxID=196869 RepID=UPI000EB48426|nr:MULTISPECIES: PKD domain-containing protein [unclassified Flavobacterium]RKR10490.1 PKD domain-containing protein [Flavobacterium sp. 81]TCK54275.1 PKD domain-containing protein [Flavobacterium sp. 90]
MKKIATVLILITIVFITNSCSKELESIVDCTGESVLVKLEHTADEANSKKINYSFYYAGSGTVRAVTWTFGDGKPSVAGNDVSHTYNTSGSYVVKAEVTIRKNGTDCHMTPQKTLTVN